MTAAPYDLILGLDRADQKADLCLIATATGQRRTAVVDTAPRRCANGWPNCASNIPPPAWASEGGTRDFNAKAQRGGAAKIRRANTAPVR